MYNRGERVLVSACLVGIKCRFDAKGKRDHAVLKALKGKLFIPVCPEQLGGLPTPRPTAAIEGGDGVLVLEGKGRVINERGEDVTENFLRGAQQTLNIARLTGTKVAILKERSPSCGVEKIIRDGQVLKGSGVTAALLLREGLEVMSEEKIRRQL